METIGPPRSFRITEDQYSEIEYLVKKKDYKFTSVSHFIRCAIVKLLDEENGRKD